MKRNEIERTLEWALNRLEHKRLSREYIEAVKAGKITRNGKVLTIKDI